MKQEKNNLENSSSSKNSPKNNLTATMKKNLDLELNVKKNLPIIIDSLIEGNTLTGSIESKITNPMGISLGKFYSILKKNPEIEQQVLDARKIGIQTSIDRLLEIFNHQELENPNQILWITRKADFVKWIAGKITDLYSDNKVQKVDQKTEMKISWGTDEDNLIDANAEDIPTSTPNKRLIKRYFHHTITHIFSFDTRKFFF
jgi:S-ribosylhomocysteine lyase LuxS involved in autoinducer biosynthesis